MKHFAKLTVFLGALALCAGMAGAQDDPIKERKEVMKSIGKSAGMAGKMLKGEMEYDADKAKEAMDIIEDGAKKFVTLFPEGSMEDPLSDSKYSAKEEVWAKMDEFKHHAEELAEYAEKAGNAADDSKEAFAAAVKKMFGECKDCHEDFRMKR